MTRYIDADALKKAMDGYWGRCQRIKKPRNGETAVFLDVMATVENQPTIDAVPRWIPCSERLPEEPFGCLVTVWDTDPVTMDEFENILPYFVGWDGEQWNDADGEQCPFEVLAWMPLPKPYEVKE